MRYSTWVESKKAMALKTLLPSTIVELNAWAFSFAALLILSISWATLVSSHVPLPYLDEIFHIRQAQKYCDGFFNEWDPKITTPPGLYLIAAINRKYGKSLFGPDCIPESLRKTNAVWLTCIVFNACCHYLIHQRKANEQHDVSSISNTQKSRALIRDIHLSFNICLFPLLFFFSGLYYTDVGSTSFVLLQLYLQQNRDLKRFPLWRSMNLLFMGLVALLFRQTNIFWVAVFPAALDIVALLEPSMLSSSHKVTENAREKHVLQRSWETGFMYDLHFDLATFEDFILILVTIVLASLRRIPQILKVTWHYLLLIIGFIGFVVWNGGVVLGDKSNHVVTLHLSQMLYIWPLISFFSLPIIFPRLIATFTPSHLLPNFLPRYHLSSPRRLKHGSVLRAALSYTTILLLMLLTIHKNTMIHPFTLADNRHYVFYVFKILRRHPAIKYLAAPIYLICSYAVIQSFCSPAPPIRMTKVSASSSGKSGKASANTLNPSLGVSRQTKASYVLIWILTTTATLITAPLVEPRYFILPWIFWRLSVPSPPIQPPENPISTLASSASKPKPPNPVATRLQYGASLLNHGDYALVLETVWFLLINAVTGYVFLYKGFEWPQEPGAIQRFMW